MSICLSVTSPFNTIYKLRQAIYLLVYEQLNIYILTHISINHRLLIPLNVYVLLFVRIAYRFSSFWRECLSRSIQYKLQSLSQPLCTSTMALCMHGMLVIHPMCTSVCSRNPKPCSFSHTSFIISFLTCRPIRSLMCG